MVLGVEVTICHNLAFGWSTGVRLGHQVQELHCQGQVVRHVVGSDHIEVDCCWDQGQFPAVLDIHQSSVSCVFAVLVHIQVQSLSIQCSLVVVKCWVSSMYIQTSSVCIDHSLTLPGLLLLLQVEVVILIQGRKTGCGGGGSDSDMWS